MEIESFDFIDILGWKIDFIDILGWKITKYDKVDI